MSTQPSSTHPDEMDIQDIFSLFKRSWYSFLALIFKGIDFIFKFWWILALLIVGGITLGYFSDNSSGYKSRLILKTNYQSQSYVYNAVIQFNQNISEGDVEFMQSVGLNPADPGIGKVSIEPVIDVVGLLDNIETSNRTLEAVIEQLEVEDDSELFATDRFYRNYKFHVVEIEMSAEKDVAAIDAFMNYINEQPYARALANEGKKNFAERIARNEKSIEQIDKVVDAYAETAEIARGSLDNLAFYNNPSNVNLREIFMYKTELVTETQQLKNEMVEVGDTAVVVSSIQTSKDSSITDKKYIIYPILFVFVFLFLAGVRFTYVTMRKKVQEANLLD